MGRRPSRWLSVSSGKIDVFYIMYTFSIAIVLTSERAMRLSAFAKGASMPSMSNTMESYYFISSEAFSRSRTEILRFSASRRAW